MSASKPWKKGQKVYLAQLNDKGHFDVLIGHVTRLEGERVLVAMRDPDGDRMVLDRHPRDLCRSQQEALVSCIRKTAAGIYACVSDLIGLCNRLSL